MAEFVGLHVDEDPDHFQQLFLSNQLGDLCQLEVYTCQMHKWLIKGNAYGHPTFMKRYIQSLPGSLTEAMNLYFKEKNIQLTGMTLKMVEGHVKRVIQEHCLAKRVN